MIKRNFLEIKALIFDCDGVILDSNKIKTKAFYEVTKRYGENEARQLCNFHINNGGISRNIKFKHFFLEILKVNPSENEIENLLEDYSHFVSEYLIACPMSEKLIEFREKTSNVPWALLSGGNQNELRAIFKLRNIEHLFDLGIFGSPESKEEILSREFNDKNFLKPALFFGDSQYDHVVSKKFNMNFIFIHEWTEFKGWKEYCNRESISFTKRISDLITFAENNESFCC